MNEAFQARSAEIRAKGLVFAALSGVGMFAIALAALHWLQPDLDPFEIPFSFYVNGAYGWLLTLGLLGLGIGGLALHRAVRDRVGQAPGVRELFLFGGAVFMVALFPADSWYPWDRAPSAVGSIHIAIALFVFLIFAAATIQLSREPSWNRYTSVLLGVSTAYFGSLVWFMVTALPILMYHDPLPLHGFAERLVVFFAVAWLVIFTFGLMKPVHME